VWLRLWSRPALDSPPRSYVGIDLMQAQVELAQRLDLPGTSSPSWTPPTRRVRKREQGPGRDLRYPAPHSRLARALGRPTGFCAWGRVVCRRAGQPLIRLFDRAFHFEHPDRPSSVLTCSSASSRASVQLSHRRRIAGFGLYGARKERGFRCRLMECHHEEVKKGVLRRLLALVEVAFSNSMIEAGGIPTPPVALTAYARQLQQCAAVGCLYVINTTK